jgi:chromosome segregation ATPase
MLTIDELHEADMKHEAAIAELRAGQKELRDLGSRHDAHIKLLDDMMVELRETLATKEDIAGLRSDLRERLDRDELLDERIDHYRQRIVDLEVERAEKAAARDSRFNRGMSWAMIALFVGEILLGWLGLRHGK